MGTRSTRTAAAVALAGKGKKKTKVSKLPRRRTGSRRKFNKRLRSAAAVLEKKVAAENGVSMNLRVSSRQLKKRNRRAAAAALAAQAAQVEDEEVVMEEGKEEEEDDGAEKELSSSRTDYDTGDIVKGIKAKEKMEDATRSKLLNAIMLVYSDPNKNYRKMVQQFPGIPSREV
jgi:hypothetical protein